MAYKSKRYTQQHQITLKPKIGVIKTSMGDRMIGQMHKINLPGADRTIFHDLACDLYYSLYKVSPQLVDDKTLPPERLVTHAMMQHVLQQDYYMNARMDTVLSTPEAHVAVTALWDTLMNDKIMLQALEMAQAAEDKINQAKDRLDKERQNQARDKKRQEQENDKNKQKGSDKQDQQDQQQGEGQDDEQGEGQGEDQQDQQQSQAERDYQQALQEAQALAQRVANSGIINQSMKNALKEASDAAGDMRSSLSSWGFNRGHAQEISVETAMRLSAQSGFLSEVAETIGRVAKASSSALEQVREGYVGAPTRVADTRDFSRIFPTERLHLSASAPPIMRALTVSRYARSGLLGWQPASEGQKSGPFVAYVDGSGSMDGYKHIAAKAIAYGLARILMTDQRRQNAFRLREFGAAGQISNFVSHESSPDRIVGWVEHFYDAGDTDFDTPLSTAIRDIDQMKQTGVVGADVVMITDGQARISSSVREAFNKMRAETGVRLFFILITDDNGQSATESIKMLSDFVIQIDAYEFSKNPEKIAVEIIENMYRKEDAK